MERDGICGMDSEMGNTRAEAATFSLSLITCFMFELCARIPLMEPKINFQNNAIGVLLYKLLCIALIFSLGPITRNEMTGTKDLIILRPYWYICMFISRNIIYIYIDKIYIAYLDIHTSVFSLAIQILPVSSHPHHCGVSPSLWGVSIKKLLPVW